METTNDDAAGNPDHLGWKPHWMRWRDGNGGWVMRPAQAQFIHWMDGSYYYQSKFHWVCPFGVAQMDNGEIILVGVVDQSGKKEKTVVAFSRDGGESWTPLKRIGRYVLGRPMCLTYLGKRELMFLASYKDEPVRFFSKNYGRTWRERVPVPVSSYGKPVGNEGNYLVDRDAKGRATRIAGFGWMGPSEYNYPVDAAIGGLHWSEDGGRTWSKEDCPDAWRWTDEHEGKVYERGTSEGSLVRAANGWIVAALRTDMHPRFIPFHNDNLEGTGVSISKDDGATWSPIRTVYPAGRMHAHLLRMPDGTLVMTFIMRQDVQEGRMASYTRGCGAVLSYDNGLTWDTEHDYLLDSFAFADGTPLALACGHIYSTLLDDGSILTCYGRYPSKGGCLVRWTPAKEPGLVARG